MTEAENKRNDKTDWNTLGLWAGVILALVFGIGGVGAGLAIALKNLDARTSGMETRELAIAFERGQYTERVDALRAAFIKFDTDIQREMRDLDNAIIQMLKELDEKLQAEIERAGTLSANAREELQKILDEVRTYQDRAREWNATQDERMRGLEREFYDDTETIQ